MLNNYIQLAGIIAGPSDAEILFAKIMLGIFGTWLFSILISFITNIIAIFKHKKHPEKKLKIYLIAQIFTLISHASFIGLIILFSTISSHILLLLIILLITEVILFKWYKRNDKNKKKQLIIQTVSTIIPFIVARIVILIVTLIEMF